MLKKIRHRLKPRGG